MRAKQKKYGEQWQQEYWKRLHSPKQSPSLTAEQFVGAIIARAKNGTFTGGKMQRLDFKIDEDNREVVELLSWYFTKDERFSKAGYDLNKGLFLYGVTGCGKTTLMRLCRENQFQPFVVVSAREVAMQYSDIGNDVIRRYSKLPAGDFGITKKTVGVCFDDLGAETDRSHFKDTLNVMAEIILGRYDYVPFNCTHFTTNLTAKDLLTGYGAKVTSRLREMVNIIEYDDKATDRR